jgi:hypothetical protein
MGCGIGLRRRPGSDGLTADVMGGGQHGIVTFALFRHYRA